MNGRVYDPKLARFGQADPFIQAPSNTQSYNRYSYVWNNPLNKDDPSGYYVFDILDAVGDSLDEVSLGRHIFREVGYENASMLHSIGTAACGPWAALCAGVGGWNLADTFGAEQSDAIWSGVTGAVSAFAFSSVADTIGNAEWATSGGDIPIGGGTKLNTTGFTALVAAQGTVGGIATVAQGGEFKDGFVSAGLSKLASPFLPDTGAHIGDIDVGQVAISAVIGGTSSELTGGKFANGAVTGAFVNIFNQQSAIAQDDGRSCGGRPCVDRGDGESLWPSGVLAIGTEGTGVGGFLGLKGGSGIYYDFSKNDWGYYSNLGEGVSGYNDALVGGVDFQAAITIDYAPSMEFFTGAGVESGLSMGIFGIDHTVVPGKGTYWGIDVGPGIGSSVVKTEAQGWSF